jgi:hypothetical protein
MRRFSLATSSTVGGEVGKNALRGTMSIDVVIQAFAWSQATSNTKPYKGGRVQQWITAASPNHLL